MELRRLVCQLRAHGFYVLDEGLEADAPGVAGRSCTSVASA